MKAIKNNIRITMVLVAMFITSATFAQPQGGGQGGPPSIPSAKQIKKMVAELGETLSLSEEQSTEVSALYTSHFEEVEKLQEAGRPERSEMEALKTSFEKEVKAVLTDEQSEAYDEYLKTQSKKQKGGRPQR